MEGIFIKHEVLIIPTNSDTIIIIYDCNSVKSGVPTSIYSTIPLGVSWAGRKGWCDRGMRKGGLRKWVEVYEYVKTLWGWICITLLKNYIMVSYGRKMTSFSNYHDNL
jgi:hypothetical protein